MRMRILIVGNLDVGDGQGKNLHIIWSTDNIYRSQSFNTMRTIHRWDYSKINKQFIFIDQNGFGDFKLNSPIFWVKFFNVKQYSQ